MAFERGGQLGDEVGYQVRFDRKWCERTRILVVTEGTLVRMLQDDPFLDSVAVVVFDEFHERSLDTDLSLGMVRRVQQTVRPDLKVVVMSATLGVEAVSGFGKRSDRLQRRSVVPGRNLVRTTRGKRALGSRSCSRGGATVVRDGRHPRLSAWTA